MKDYVLIYKGSKYYLSGWFKESKFRIATIKQNELLLTDKIKEFYPEIYSDLTTQIEIDYLAHL